jgi:AraC-like DNA-binding protein
MHVVREPQMISGFLYNKPVPEIPALTHCGEALCCSGYLLAPHRHPGFEFIYLSRGTYHWRVGENEYTSKMGNLFITQPGEVHSTGQPPSMENQHVWLGLQLGRLSPEGARVGRRIQRYRVRLVVDCQEIELLLHGIIRQVVESRPRRAETIRTLLAAFIALLEQKLVTGGAGSPTAPLPYTARVQRVVAFMRQNLDRRLSLRELAAVGMMRATTHFCTRFHQEVGVTPAIHHLHLRLEGAREALRQPSSDITRVALQFGFSSSQHFSDHFRRAYGVTPGRWRAAKV